MQKRSGSPIIFYPKSEETKHATLDALLSCNISLCKQGQQRGRHHMAMAMAWERAWAEVSRCLPALQQGPELFGILCMLKMGQASKSLLCGEVTLTRGTRVFNHNKRGDRFGDNMWMDCANLPCISGCYQLAYTNIHQICCVGCVTRGVRSDTPTEGEVVAVQSWPKKLS